MQLHRRQRSGQRAVGIAVHQRPIRFFLKQHALNHLDHPPGVLAMRAAADAEVIVGARDVEFIEEHVAHIGVVMLAGMHQHLAHRRAMLAERPRHHGGLDELRAGTHDSGDFQAINS